MERTYIMIKPDGVQRGLVGEIISRFEKKGFKLQGDTKLENSFRDNAITYIICILSGNFTMSIVQVCLI